MWVPNVFVSQKSKMYDPNAPSSNYPVVMRYDGLATVNVPWNIDTKCVYNLYEFPHDHHICEITLKSYEGDDVFLSSHKNV